MWDNESIGCLAYFIVLIICIACLLWLLRDQSETGTLYYVGSDEPVCTGTLLVEKHAYGNETYSFTCEDGRVIKEVTNFILK